MNRIISTSNRLSRSLGMDSIISRISKVITLVSVFGFVFGVSTSAVFAETALGSASGVGQVGPRTTGEASEQIKGSALVNLDGRMTVCGCWICGYVTYMGEDPGYEIYMYDFIHYCEEAEGVENVHWEFSGNVDEPSSCTGTVAECAGIIPHYVTGCDEDATFHVYYYDDSWGLLVDYEFTDNEIYYYESCS